MTTDPLMQATIGKARKGRAESGMPISTALLYGIKEFVNGQNCTFKGLEDYVRGCDIELALRNDIQYKQVMHEFIAQQPELWNEDTGE